MRRTNKGYTLVELLVTMAIFAIVMVGVTSLMNSTSKSYQKGFFEVKNQEDVQIVTNQISDLLVDATNVVVQSTNAEGCDVYSFTDDEGMTNYVNLIYDQVNKTISLDKDSEVALLADNVDSFSISGIGVEKSANNGDNLCEVSLSIKNKDQVFDAVKEVSFRNNVENNIAKSMFQTISTTNTTTPGSEFKDTFNVLRGEEVNITALYGIDENCALSSNATKYFTLSDYSGYGKKNYYILSVNSNMNNPANFNTAIDDDSIYVCKRTTMKDEKGKNIVVESDKVKLTVDAVSLSNESGVLLLTQENCNHGGGNTTYISAKGINVNEWLKNSSGSLECTTTLKVVGGSESSKNSTVLAATASDVAYSTSGVAQVPYKITESQKGRLEIGVSGDQCSNGMSVVTNNVAFTPEQGALPSIEYVKFSLNFKNTYSFTTDLTYNVQLTTYQDISVFN